MLNGTDVQKIVTRLEGFFRNEKGMEVQSSKTTEGYVMQASQPKDGWKTLTGMRLAVSRADDGYGKSIECKHRRRTVVG